MFNAGRISYFWPIHSAPRLPDQHPSPFCELVGAGTLALLLKSYSRKLAEIILVIPFCQFGAVAYDGIAKRQTASIYLNVLKSY